MTNFELLNLMMTDAFYEDFEDQLFCNSVVGGSYENTEKVLRAFLVFFFEVLLGWIKFIQQIKAYNYV